MIEAPKTFYLRVHKDEAIEMSQIAEGRILRLAMVYTWAQLAFGGATQEQLAGAKAFADILMNIGEPKEPTPEFPNKALKGG